MGDEVKAVHREPHPFIGLNHLANFVGKPVAFVGRIDRFEENTMFLKTAEGKFKNSYFVGLKEDFIKSALKIIHHYCKYE